MSGSYSTQFQNERAARAGELLESGADVIPAIHRVAAECGCEQLAAECIGDLPARDI